ncbi:MAG: AEC family transporter [Clostridia bacterium]|nr:AEC family transporter [Clostridia bacterium]
MQIEFTNVAFTILSLIALAIPGFILAKTGLLGDKADSALSNVVLYACQPALVFIGFQGKNYSPEIGVNMLITAGLAFAIHLIMAGIMAVCVRNKDNDAKLNCLRFASIFGNCGFIGLPMIQSLFSGQDCIGEAVIYCAVMIAVFNILTWTLGVYIITKDIKNVSFKKILLNPTIIAVVLGFMAFVLAKVPLVDLCVEGSFGDVFVTKMMNSVTLVGNAVTPVSMMVIGFRLARVDMKTVFMNKLGYVDSFFKLIVATIVTMLVVTFLPISSVIKYVLFFLFAMPSATSTALFAVKFGSDANSSSIMVLLSSILSIATIPLMFLLYTGVFGAFI